MPVTLSALSAKKCCFFTPASPSAASRRTGRLRLCRSSADPEAGAPGREPVTVARADLDEGRDGASVRTATAADSVTLSSLDDAEESGGRGTVVGSALAVGGLLALIGASIYYQDTIRTFLVYFSTIIEDWGPRGVLAYFVVYTILEVLAVPAIPLTMTAGAIFGILPGSLLTSLAGTLAATISFLIARYVARDRFLPWAQKNKQFRAVDRVISTNGFQVVTLLRLSPLLPLAASNYLYGLTSVSLPSYFFGSWIGTLPGTIAYVSAGHVGKVAFLDGGSVPLQWWQIAIAVGLSGLAITYIGNLAKKALADIEEDEGTGSLDQPGGGAPGAGGATVQSHDPHHHT